MPREYPTIQSALDVISAWDTILVDTGSYAEALTAPPFSFALIGSVDSASGSIVRSVVDPAPLENPSTRTCFITVADTTVIYNMVFRNGPRMHPHETNVAGGIRHHGRRLELHSCIFDSTHRGIWTTEGEEMLLYGCAFQHNINAAVLAMEGRFIAEDCFFETDSAEWGSAYSVSDSRYVRNTFVRNGILGPDVSAWGDRVVIQDCIFDPAGPFLGRSVAVSAHVTLIERNIFRNTRVVGSSLGVSTRCPGETVIRENIFRGEGPPQTGSSRNCLGVLNEYEDSTCIGHAIVTIVDNLFENGYSESPGKAINVGERGISVRHNRCVNMQPVEFPTVDVTRSDQPIRDNRFDGTGYALRCQLGESLDAALNWWGDSTGPYHPELNPHGQGDAVGDGVTFEPWYRDTLFFQDVPVFAPPLPAEAKLEVFPNPFNTETRIRLTVDHAFIVIELFDILGRKVRELFAGYVTGEQEVIFASNELSSGIYFVRAWDKIENQSLAMSKLVLMK